MNKKKLMEICERYKGKVSLLLLLREQYSAEVVIVIEEPEIPELDEIAESSPPLPPYPVFVDHFPMESEYRVYFPESWKGNYNNGEWPYMYPQYIPLSER